MKTMILTLVALMMVAGSVEAKGKKAPKPVVCVDYALIADESADGREVAVCYDKHVEGGLTLRYFREVSVEMPGTHGALVNIVVGWR